ncbi:MAG: ABC transporter ATP-binding protein/permease [Anaerolineae bacterium]|nr:ABC transporter ATP-binding protein/permease [Anaerolineae bacterium]
MAAQVTTSPPPVADMHWLGGFVYQYRFAAFAAIVYGAAGGITSALEPYLIGIIVDHVSRGVRLEQVAQDILLLVGLSLVTVLAFWGQRHYSGTIAYGVQSEVRRSVFRHMVTLDQGFYQRYAVGDLISRMYSDMEWVWRVLALGFNRGGSALLTCIVTILLLGSINIPLTVLVFVTLAISTYFQIRAGTALIRLSEEVQDQAGELSSLVQDTVSGIQTLKTFGREDYASRKFLAENQEYRRRWLYFKRRNEPVGMLPQMIAYLTTGIVVVVGGNMALSGQISLGNFTQFLLYLNLISNVLLQLGTIYQRFQQTRGALKRITPLLQPPGIKDADDAIALAQPRGAIRFEHVGLKGSTDGKWLLRDIDLEIPAGQVVGLVGPTGCGKTLLVNLISRVSDPDEGSVYLDGVDLRHLHLDDVRRAVAYVPQSTFLFSQPLHENVRMGKPDLSEEELQRAIHIARVSNDLPQLPHGLETLVGEKGVMLSGGQKQRVAIARAIAHDPAILVLDDALSSVDTRTAAEILGDLRQVLRTRTSIIIAHRVATVKDADLIVVMEGGRIVEQGSHAHLIARQGIYARMVERELDEEARRQADEEASRI